mgnify:CR=1 FL=1
MNKQKKPFQYLLEDILDKALLESLLLSVVFTLFDFFGGRLYFPILSKQVFGVFAKNFILFFVLAVLFDLITHAASFPKAFLLQFWNHKIARTITVLVVLGVIVLVGILFFSRDARITELIQICDQASTLESDVLPEELIDEIYADGQVSFYVINPKYEQIAALTSTEHTAGFVKDGELLCEFTIYEDPQTPLSQGGNPVFFWRGLYFTMA